MCKIKYFNISKLKFFCFLLCIFFDLGAKEPSKTTVCLNMIVKDESKVIERCLNSLKGFIDYWVIVDTGSKDGTQEIIRKCMSDIPGELYEHPWVNFAHNRNEALALAKNKGDYVLFIDADEKLVFSENFQKPILDKDYYFILCENFGVKYGRVQIINNHLNWIWDGVVHEVIKSLDSHEKSYAMLEDVVNAISWDGMRSQDPEKYHKDAQVLEKALEKDPTNTRNTFYLAKSYQDSNEPLKALETFKKRSLMGQFDLEVHWSLYQIGILEEKLNMPHETVVASYCKAYQSCPERAEPLYQLARYYNKCEKYVLSYVITQYALTLPEPKESLFLEAWIYEFGNLIEFSTAAYKIGKYEEARKACVQLLSKSNLPEVIRPSIENNLSCLKDIERK